MSPRRRNRLTAQEPGRPGLLWRAGSRAPIRVELVQETETHLIVRWLQRGLAHRRGSLSRVPKARAKFTPRK